MKTPMCAPNHRSADSLISQLTRTHSNWGVNLSELGWVIFSWVRVRGNPVEENFRESESEWVQSAKHSSWVSEWAFADVMSCLLILSLTISLTWIHIYTRVYSRVFQSSVIHTPFQYLIVRGMNYLKGCLDPTPLNFPGKFLIIMSNAVISSIKNDFTDLEELWTRFWSYYVKRHHEEHRLRWVSMNFIRVLGKKIAVAKASPINPTAPARSGPIDREIGVEDHNTTGEEANSRQTDSRQKLTHSHSDWAISLSLSEFGWVMFWRVWVRASPVE